MREGCRVPVDVDRREQAAELAPVEDEDVAQSMRPLMRLRSGRVDVQSGEAVRYVVGLASPRICDLDQPSPRLLGHS